MTELSIRIYLGGPGVWRPDVTQHALELKRLCKIHGAEGMFPLDNEFRPVPGQKLPNLIRVGNQAMIRAADAMIADMTPFRGTSMDGGTAFEMGFCEALEKPVYGYTNDFRTWADRVMSAMPCTTDADGIMRDPDGFQVEEFGTDSLIDNLMMADAASGIFDTAEEAIVAAVAEVRRRRAFTESGSLDRIRRNG